MCNLSYLWMVCRKSNHNGKWTYNYWSKSRHKCSKIDLRSKVDSREFSGYRYGQAPPVPSTRTVHRSTPEVKPYKFCEGSHAKKRAIHRQIEPPSIRSIYTTPKEIRHHSSSIPSPTSSIAIAITIVIEISLRVGDHFKNIVISIQVFTTMISIFDLVIMREYSSRAMGWSESSQCLCASNHMSFM